MIAQFALPQRERAPAASVQHGQHRMMPPAIAGDLFPPIIAIVLGSARAAPTIMPVPETAMHEYRLATADKGYVRLARHVGAVEAF